MRIRVIQINFNLVIGNVPRRMFQLAPISRQCSCQGNRFFLYLPLTFNKNIQKKNFSKENSIFSGKRLYSTSTESSTKPQTSSYSSHHPIDNNNTRSTSNDTFRAIKYLETSTDFLSKIESEISGKAPKNEIQVKKTEEYSRENLQSLTLIQMMNAGMHFGHSKATLSPYFRQYVLGVRHGIVIIDLDKTLACLRRACQVAYEIGRLGGIILLVGTRPSYSGLVERIARDTGVFFISTQWKNGLLTNSKRTLKIATDTDAILFTPIRPTDEMGPLAQKALLEKTIDNTYEKHEISNESTNVPSYISLPDLVIVIDGPTNSKAFEECHSSLIPTIGIIDSNFDSTHCTYPIPANDDSVASVDFILSLLATSIRDGRTRTFPHL